MFRGFIAIDIGNKILPEIKKLIDEMKHIDCDIRYVQPENIHITLKFLGNIDENMVPKIDDIMKQSIDNIEQFRVEFSGMGVFPDWSYIRVIWIGVNDKNRITEICNRLEQKLSKIDVKKDNREFRPHITIGRVKTRRNITLLRDFIAQNKERFFGEMNVGEIKLKKSILTPNGAVYSDISTISF